MLIIGTLVFFLLAPASGHGKTIGNTDSDLRLPKNFGEVVYQQHRDRGDRDNRIYIIAQSHRSAISGEENDGCQEVQAEIYRIGEWLIANEKVDSLLPEGYFSDPSSDSGLKPIRTRGELRQFEKLDDVKLAALLSNKTSFVNADRLLYDTYDLALHQIEDRKLFFTVVDQLRTLLSNSPWQQNDPTTLPSLLYHQKKRSAVILENIPGALTDKNSEDGNPVRIHRAMLTIGLSHVDTMIDFLKNGKAQILPPPGMEDRIKEYTCELNSVTESYAVFFIIPRALKGSRERLRYRN